MFTCTQTHALHTYAHTYVHTHTTPYTHITCTNTKKRKCHTQVRAIALTESSKIPGTLGKNPLLRLQGANGLKEFCFQIHIFAYALTARLY